MSHHPSLERLKFALLWAGLALAAFLGFQLMFPPKPEVIPLFATCGFMLVAALLYHWRGTLLQRSLAFASVGAVAYLIAWNRGVPVLYAFSAACLAIVCASHLMPRWVLRAMEGRIALPAWIQQGDHAMLGVNVRNPAAAAVRMLEVVVPLEGGIGSDLPARALLMQLAAGQSSDLALNSPLMRRGHHLVGPLTVSTGFPLGLAVSSFEVEGSARRLWVYPRLFHVEFVPIAGEQFQSIGEVISPRTGGAEEFAGVREYRHGDSRRHIHWRASARHGELVVKEFTRRSATTVTIALDLSQRACIGEGIETTTEYVVRIAGSVARYALTQGHHVQLALCGSGVERIGPLRGAGELERILRVLALARAEGGKSFGESAAAIAAIAPAESTVVLVYVDAHAGSFAFAGALLGKGIHVVPVVVDAASFGESARAPAATPSSGRVRRAQRGCDLSSLFRQ